MFHTSYLVFGCSVCVTLLFFPGYFSRTTPALRACCI
jgi:hypothetical protein